MNAKQTTPPAHNFWERLLHKVPFSVKGNEDIISSKSEEGVLIKVDQSRSIAIAFFDNTHDYNAFKRIVA